MTAAPAPSLAAIRAAHGAKRGYERCLVLSRWLFRPLGFAATWALLRLGVSSEAVSWLSALVGLAGIAALVAGSEGAGVAGLVLLALFNLLDCVDGSLARSAGTGNPYGRFLDSACGAVVDLAFWAAVGVAAFRHPAQAGAVAPSLTWLAVGGAACFLAALLLVVERAYDELLAGPWSRLAGAGPPGAIAGSDAPGSLLRQLERNLRVRETHYALLAVAWWAAALHVLLAGALVYYLARVSVTLAVYVRRGRVVRRAWR